MLTDLLINLRKLLVITSMNQPKLNYFARLVLNTLQFCRQSHLVFSFFFDSYANKVTMFHILVS